MTKLLKDYIYRWIMESKFFILKRDYGLVKNRKNERILLYKKICKKQKL